MKTRSPAQTATDKQYLDALRNTLELFDGILEHIREHRGQGKGIPPYPISATTPIGRIQFIQYVLQEAGITAEVVPSGRIGWEACLIFPEEKGTCTH